MTDPNRQTGRTTRALLALPNGGVYVVHTQKMVPYCWNILRQAGRRPDAIRFVTPNPRELEKLLALPRNTPWAMDHVAWEYKRREAAEAFDFLSAAFPQEDR